MLSGSRRYLYLFPRKIMLSIIIVFVYASLVQAQNKLTATGGPANHFSPLFMTSLKKPVKPSDGLNEYFKSPKNQLMFWPDYPLTAAQIETRNQEWERVHSHTLGEQIAGDIIKTYVNALIYGKPHTAASIPKF